MNRTQEILSRLEEGNEVQQFIELTQHFSRLAALHGLDIKPFRGAGPTYFSKLPSELQTKTLSVFGRYVEVCEDVSDAGKSLRDDNHLLWRMFRKLEVHPSSKLMNHLNEGDIIEIYNTEYIQIFRNFEFFSLCSYTLDDLLSRPFWELFKREDAVTQRILELASQVFDGTLPGIVYWDMGVHTVKEIDGPGQYVTTLENKVLSPLLDLSGKPIALVNIIKTIEQTRSSLKH